MRPAGLLGLDYLREGAPLVVWKRTTYGGPREPEDSRSVWHNLPDRRDPSFMTDVMNELGASSKVNSEWAFLEMLREEGRRAAGAFLGEHAEDLGHRSTADLDLLLAEC